MKRIVAVLAVLGIAAAVFRGKGPALMERAHNKCLEMFQACQPKPAGST